ncbi:MAG: ArsR/SmtB family transcription factor [Actinomycetota bacterium]
MPTGLKLRLASDQVPAQCCGPLASKPIKDTEAVATATLFKALADPHRVKIVNLLATSPGPVCVCDITDAIGLSQPTVSFHLKKLTAAGLLQRERRGTWGYYSLDQAAAKRLAVVVDTQKAVSGQTDTRRTERRVSRG